ncbi:MAG: hypothetical protein CM1200mP40_20670 [Gammaproteobacteria bacterium]|nr:MAG: hypothetical protein CM1200mP40_20670 [Gammaproteobacteria bacterium]
MKKKMLKKLFKNKFLLAGALLFVPTVASAQDINGADTAWILTSTALVLFMTLPGLSLFYGGLVRTRMCCLSSCSAFPLQ